MDGHKPLLFSFKGGAQHLSTQLSSPLATSRSYDRVPLTAREAGKCSLHSAWLCAQKKAVTGRGQCTWETISQLVYVAPAWGDQLSCFAQD